MRSVGGWALPIGTRGTQSSESLSASLCRWPLRSRERCAEVKFHDARHMPGCEYAGEVDEISPGTERAARAF